LTMTATPKTPLWRNGSCGPCFQVSHVWFDEAKVWEVVTGPEVWLQNHRNHNKCPAINVMPGGLLDAQSEVKLLPCSLDK
jgi:hypothetical protein